MATILRWAGGVFEVSWLEREGRAADDAGRIDAILSALGTHALMPGLAGAGRPSPRDPNSTMLTGNFWAVSGSFCIETTDPVLVARFNALVRSNVATRAYRDACREDAAWRATWGRGRVA